MKNLTLSFILTLALCSFVQGYCDTYKYENKLIARCDDSKWLIKYVNFWCYKVDYELEVEVKKSIGFTSEDFASLMNQCNKTKSLKLKSLILNDAPDLHNNGVYDLVIPDNSFTSKLEKIQISEKNKNVDKVLEKVFFQNPSNNLSKFVFKLKFVHL